MVEETGLMVSMTLEELNLMIKQLEKDEEMISFVKYFINGKMKYETYVKMVEYYDKKVAELQEKEGKNE